MLSLNYGHRFYRKALFARLLSINGQGQACVYVCLRVTRGTHVPKSSKPFECPKQFGVEQFIGFCAEHRRQPAISEWHVRFLES